MAQGLAVLGYLCIFYACGGLFLRIYFFENLKILGEVRKPWDILKLEKMRYLALLIAEVVQLARVFLKDTLNKVAIVFSNFFVRCF